MLDQVIEAAAKLANGGITLILVTLLLISWTALWKLFVRFADQSEKNTAALLANAAAMDRLTQAVERVADTSEGTRTLLQASLALAIPRGPHPSGS